MALFPITELDSQQVLKYAYDQATQSLRTSGSANITATGDIAVSIDHVSDSIAIGTTAQLFTGTTVGSDHGLDVNVIGGSISGTLNPVGLKDGLATTAITITDTPIKVPPVSIIATQNSISVRVWGANTVYFGNSGVTDAIGYPKRQFEEVVLDIQQSASAELWAVCPAGVSSQLRVMAIG